MLQNGCTGFHEIVRGTMATGQVGAVLMEQNDEWQTRGRYMQIEGMADMTNPIVDAQPLQITPKAA